MEVRENVKPMEDEVPFGVEVEAMDVAPMDDMEADACVQKIGNWERYRDFWLDYYQKRIDEVNQKCDRNVAYQRRKLREFFRSVPHRHLKASEAYDLPSGKISMSYPTPKMIPNKADILERFKKNGDTQFIKVKEELDWNGYKSRLFISDSGDVLDKETGEVVKDVLVEVSEPDITVTNNKKVSDEE